MTPEELDAFLKDRIAKRKLNDATALRPGSADRLARMQALNAAAQEAPAGPNPYEGMVLRGRARPGAAASGVSEVSGGDPAARSALQRAFVDRQTIGARDAFSNAARERAREMADKGIARPTREGNNAARREARLQMMQRLAMMQVAPQIAMIQAQHGNDPLKDANANYFRAATLGKLVEAGVPLDQAMKHPMVAQPGPAPAPQAPLTPGQLRAQNLDTPGMRAAGIGAPVGASVVNRPAGGSPDTYAGNFYNTYVESYNKMRRMRDKLAGQYAPYMPDNMLFGAAR